MAKTIKHPSTRAIEKMGYRELTAPLAAHLLTQEQIKRVVGQIYGDTRVSRQWIKDVFAADSEVQFLEASLKWPSERHVLAVCPNGAYAEAFFVQRDSVALDFLVTIEQEERRPFGERPEEKRARQAKEEAAEVAKLSPKKRAMMAVRQTVEDEGFDYAFRRYSSFDDITDKRFHALRKAYVAAAEALENYIAK